MADAGKRKQSPVSWLVPGKEPELIESFQSVWKRASRKLAENYGTGGLLRGQNRGGKKRNPVRDRKKERTITAAS